MAKKVDFELLNEDLSEEFRKRLDSLPGISPNRRVTIIQEADLFGDDYESSDEGNGISKDECDSTGVSANQNVARNSSHSTGSEEDCVVETKVTLNGEPTPVVPLQPQLARPTVQYWQTLPEVVNSGILARMPKDKVQLNEALYEIFKAVRSFYKSLCIIVDHFKKPFEKMFLSDHKFICQRVFLNITTIMEVTDKLLQQLEEVQGDHVEMQAGCLKVVGHFAEEFFEEPFTKYCSKQELQNGALQDIKNIPQLSSFLNQLEQDPVCQKMPLSAFLLKPMQMLTKWPILLYAVKKNEDCIPLVKFSLKSTIARVEKLAQNCNQFRTQLAHKDKLIQLEKSIEWPKNCHYALTQNKQNTEIHYDGSHLQVWSKLFPKKIFGSFMNFGNTKEISDVRLIAFEDGCLLILEPVSQSQKRDAQFKLLNFAERWRLIVESDAIIDELQWDVQGKWMHSLRSTMKKHNSGLIVFDKPILPEPSKVLFLSPKQSASNNISILEECYHKQPNASEPLQKTPERRQTDPTDEVSKNDALKMGDEIKPIRLHHSRTIRERVQGMFKWKSTESSSQLKLNIPSNSETQSGGRKCSMPVQSELDDMMQSNGLNASDRRRKTLSEFKKKSTGQLKIANDSTNNHAEGTVSSQLENAPDEQSNSTMSSQFSAVCIGHRVTPALTGTPLKEPSASETRAESDDIEVSKGPVNGWVYGRRKSEYREGWFPLKY